MAPGEAEWATGEAEWATGEAEWATGESEWPPERLSGHREGRVATGEGKWPLGRSSQYMTLHTGWLLCVEYHMCSYVQCIEDCEG